MTDQTFRVISQPKLNFTVILNPDSGPGLSRYPGNDFVPQIQKMNSYSNVRTVGYVRTGFGTRNISSVLLDVSTYSGWATNASANANSTGLALHGIFFDEIPSEFSEEADEYLNTINQAVKNSSGLLPDKTVSKLTSVS
jgi:Spherulation-specific family 4